MGTWRKLEPGRAGDLSRARLELHWAIQLAAAPGATLLPRRDDDGHTNLAWSRAIDGLAGRPARDDGACAAIRFRDLALLVMSKDEILAEQTLAGRTFAQALRWLSDVLGRPVAPPAHALPEHPVGRGEPFAGEDGAAGVLLADWFADAGYALDLVRGDDGSEVRCWPHHFDLATRLPRGARSIGCGLSPGDTTEHGPYFYASPWPRPEHDALPELPAGARWNTDGWLGALLPGVCLEPDPDGQRAQVATFFDRAIAACDALDRLT